MNQTKLLENNLSSVIKLFYSQGYKEVYDNGNLLDTKLLYSSQTWDFSIHGLENYKSEEIYFEDLGYSLKHYFNLEDIGKYIWDLDIEGKTQYPKQLFYSYDFYHENLVQKDIGCVYKFGVSIDEHKTYVVRATNDGGRGWLEVFDFYGNILGAACTHHTKITWKTVDWIHNNFSAYPPEICNKI